MINRADRNDNRDEVKKTQGEVTGSASRPSKAEVTGTNDYTEDSHGQGVNSARRREIVEHALNHLPWGAGSESRLRALRLAREAVMDCGPTANELLIMKAANEAVEEVALDCLRRDRKEKWVRAAAHFLPFGATVDNEAQARKAACTVLDELPIDTPSYEVESRIRESLKALIGEISRRQRKRQLVTNGASYVDGVLRDLLWEHLISSSERWDSALCRDLQAAVRRELEEDLAGDETEDDLRAIVQSTVEDELGIEPASGEDEEDYEEREED